MSSNDDRSGSLKATNPEQAASASERGPGPPNLFAVITWGCAGTKWLSQALNGHPDVFCVHALRFCLGVQKGVAERLDDVGVLSAVERMGAGLRLTGEVHGIARTSVGRLKKAFGPRLRCAGLVRAPVPRLRSQLALFEYHGYSPKAWPNMDYVDSLPGFSRIAVHARSYQRLMFIHAVNMLNAVLEEQTLFPLYRLEDLSTKPAALKSFLAYISAGRVEADEAYLRWAQSLGAPNSHVRRVGGQRAFEPWQLEVVRAILRPETVVAYRALGYEIPDDWLPARLALAA
jgi:hypothetical protein